MAHVKRREFISLLGGATVVWPLAARAQQKPRVVGFLGANTPVAAGHMTSAFVTRLRDLGWIEGRNVVIEYRWAAGQTAKFRELAAELVAAGADVIVTSGNAPAIAARQATSSVPIVLASSADIMATGLVKSLARPGGNVTGFTFFEYAMFGKSLELLKKVAPAVTRCGFIFNPDMSAYYDQFLPAFETHARQYSIELTVARVGTEAEIDAAVAKLAAAPGGGLMVPPDAYTLVHRDLIVQSTAQHRIPAIYSYRQLIKEGGLMSYGPETSDIFRRSASYVDRILKGANPAELPAQAPAKFEFAINLKTATTLGLTVPPTVIALADEVIE
jgi:putative tryptophan/tyrosine transport system substrate-binding protein